MAFAEVYFGDCLKELENLEDKSVDLVYLDPPFFTQKVQKLSTRDGKKEFSFQDIWESNSEYANFIFQRLCVLKEKLKETGSIFFHCDRTASHIVRFLMDNVFGEGNFRAEIIWAFRRWSNAQRGLLPTHQTIFFYSKSDNYKFNRFFSDYSSSTNLDQIMQKRVRDHRGKAVYARDEAGEIISNGVKKGVPLSDVWEIPYLNPKAKERVGYPTQKPLLLLERIIEIVTDEGDLVVDPFCGSGTTLVAAKLLGRNSIGIDISKEAIDLIKIRLENPIKTESSLLLKGRKAYENHDQNVPGFLYGLDYSPIQRNLGIDGILKEEYRGAPVFFRVQKKGETLLNAVDSLKKATRSKGKCWLIVIQTETELFQMPDRIDSVFIVPSLSEAVKHRLENDAAFSKVE